MIAIVAALEDELAPLRQKVDITRQAEIEGSPVWEGRFAGQDLLLAQSGPGQARVSLVGGFSADYYILTTLVSIGFCGAVRAGPKPADLVLAEALYADGESEAYTSDPALLQAATAALQQAGLPFHRGGCLTATQVVGEPQAKAELGRARPEITAVDMETYWLAEVAHRYGVPFLALRIILDEVGDWVPDVSLVDETGVVQRAKAMGYLMQHPNRAPALIKLGSAVPKASAKLADAVVALLTELAAVNKAS